MSFIEIFSDSVKEVLENKFQENITKSSVTKVLTENTLNDITIIFGFENELFSQKIFYFMDRKLKLNLTKILIKEINELDLSLNISERAILEFNNIIMGNDRLIKYFENKPDYNIIRPKILKGYGTNISSNKINLSLINFNSTKGDFSIGFSEVSNMQQKEKTFENFKIPETKDKGLDEIKSGSIISTVQLLEIKHVVLTTLNEIKDLRGDSEFMLRKAKTITDLSKVWLDIIKEEG